MRRAHPLLRFHFLIASIATAIACPVPAQTPAAQNQAAQTQTTETGPAQAGQTRTTSGLIRRTPESAEQMRRSDRRMTLDVQITDASGKPLPGLQQQDLTLLDNGVAQPITSLQEVHASGGPPPAEVVLLLDTMNASFQDVVIERQGIDSFLRQNGGHLALPVSIVFLTDTGAKLGKPSQDGNLLADDLKKLQTPMRVLGAAQGGDGAQDRSQRSLRTVQMLATYEASRPGRKLLIWVGPGWPLLSRSTADVSAQSRRRYFDSIVDVTTAIRRAHLTVYSVAPLNLAQVGGPDPFLYKTYLQGVATPAQADSSNLALQVLAVHSGGLVLGRSGDLVSQIALCVADGKNYYELTFDAQDDGAAVPFHAIQINAKQPGAASSGAAASLVARTSTSYYAGVPQSTAPSESHTSEAPASAASTTSAPVKTLREETRLVTVDLTVLDKNGQPVKGLTLADLQLKEDNAAQKISSFEEHDAAEASPAAPVSDTPAAHPGTIVASNKPSAVTIWNVVLIDLFNIEKEDRSRLQSQVEQFLKQLPDHEPLALVTMSGRIKVEVSFEEGAGAAYQYLHKHGLGPLDASTPANIVGRPGQEVLMPSADLTGSAIANQANVDVDRQADRAKTTLDCFSALAQWLAPYPGRKNVYWLTGGFPMQGKQFGVVGYGQGLGAETKGGRPIPMQQKTDKELESARVAIYPVDARGVAAPNADGVTNADSTYTASVGVVTAMDNDLVAARRSEMLEIAAATGGTAQFNNNISQALGNDFHQANTYYTISYTPPDKEWKGAYHRIELAVDRPATKLVYRQGYFAQSLETAAKPTPDQFKDALRPGVPSEMAVQFTSTIARSKGSATAEYTVEPATVDFERDEAGLFLADIDFAILEFDAKGKVLDKSLVRLSGKMTAEQSAHISAKALSTKQTIALKPGATILVVGVRDRVSGRFGKVEVPLETP